VYATTETRTTDESTMILFLTGRITNAPSSNSGTRAGCGAPGGVT
jgi:hypothetical protein